MFLTKAAKYKQNVSLIPFYSHSSFTLTALSPFMTCLSSRIKTSAAKESKIYSFYILRIVQYNNKLMSNVGANRDASTDKDEELKAIASNSLLAEDTWRQKVRVD